MDKKKTIWAYSLIFIAVLLFATPAIAATTTVHIVRYANDGTTVLNETNITYQWMRDNLPVLGDGVTHYYHQGPVFIDDDNETLEQELRWNPQENTNVLEKDMGAVKGTNVKDLCDLVGGMAPGEQAKILSSDGFSKWFAYENVYGYSSREGPIGLTWYMNGNYPDSGYSDGMRLVWFADDSVNTLGPGGAGVHAFGNFDWHEAAAPEYWYYYQQGGENYPTTTGLSAKYVNRIYIYSNESPPAVAAFTANVTSGTVPLTVQFTGQSTGIAPLTYEWDFDNDGTVDSTEKSPVHTYNTAGTYTVKLTVTDAVGSDDDEVKIDYITVTPPSTAPVAAFTVKAIRILNGNFETGVLDPWVPSVLVPYGDTPGVQLVTTGSYKKNTTGIRIWRTPIGGSNWIEQDVDLTDVNEIRFWRLQYAGIDRELQVLVDGEIVARYNETSGTINRYETIDLSSYGFTGTHTLRFNSWCYGGSGLFSLYLDDIEGYGTTASGTVPLSIQFTDQSSGTPPLTYAWDFDNDGTVDSAEKSPSHIYNVVGTFTVKLTVTNAVGSDDEVKTDYITVTPLPPSIKVESPNGGEIWPLGSPQSIQWSYIENPGSTVKIEALRGETVIATIPNVPIGANGSGIYNLTVPSSTPLGDDYQFRVTSTSNPAYTDISDAPFTISSPITVVSPDGGEVWQLGSAQAVQWDYTGIPGSTVKIEALRGETVVATIPNVPIGTGGSGFYNLTVPFSTPLGDNYRFRVTSTSNPAYTDVSDGPFTIAPDTGSSITLVSPDGGEVWTQGTTQFINWTYAGNPGSMVKIEFLKGSAVLKTVTDIPTTSGSVSILVPNSTPPGDDYKVKITSTSNPAYTDTSNAPFTIGPDTSSSITLVSPDGGEVWTQGTEQYINWTSTGNPGPTVKIEVLKGSTVLKTVTGIPTSSGSYSVPVSYNTPLGDDYRVKITSTSNPAYTDTSADTFTVQSAITVVSPNGGEIWPPGSAHLLQWTYTGTPGSTVKIEALRGETVLAVISSSHPIGSAGAGSLNLTFPNSTPLGDDYRIRVTSTTYPTCTDTSNGFFSVGSPPAIDVLFNGTVSLTPEATFNVTASNSGANYIVNRTTPLGALDVAATTAGFTYDVTDKKYGESGALLLDNISIYHYQKTPRMAWYAYVNDVFKDGYDNAADALNLIALNDGDRVEFYFVNGTVADSTNLAAVKANASAAVLTIADIPSAPVMDVLFNGTVSLTPGVTFNVTAYNTNLSYTVNQTTPLGALDVAATTAGFTYGVTDKQWSGYGVLLLDNIDTYLYQKTPRQAWYAYVNDVFKDGYNNPAGGLNLIPLNDGDRVEFYFVNGAVDNPENLAAVKANASAAVLTIADTTPGPVMDVLFNGTVSLTPGVTFNVTAYNTNLTYTVNRTTPLGALDVAATTAGFTYGVTDKQWSGYGVLLLDNIDTYLYQKTPRQAWYAYVNDVFKDGYNNPAGGLNLIPLNDGDRVEFYFVNGTVADPANLAAVKANASAAVMTIASTGVIPTDWNLILDGAKVETVTKAYFESGLACPSSGHQVFWTDGEGNEWGGVPLWLLVGMVDDDPDVGPAHFNFNDGLAAEGYSVKVTAGDGYSINFESTDIARNNDYIVANTLNGEPLPLLRPNSTKPCFPLQMIGPAVTSGKLIGNINSIELVGLPEPPEGWTLSMEGDVVDIITQQYFEEGIACHHNTTYTDGSGNVWSGVPLWELLGAVDDTETASHWTFNDTRASTGYTIRVIAVDGFNRTFASGDVARSSNYIVANKKNGEPLNETDAPLRLVGANATGGKSVSKISAIRLEGLPAYPPGNWSLLLDGAISDIIPQPEFEDWAACHPAAYTDGDGNVYEGIPLWRLMGWVDDRIPHGSDGFNNALAIAGYKVIVTAGDGYSKEFTSQEIGTTNGFIIANKMNGLPLPVDGEHPPYPLRLVGAGLPSVHYSVGNVVKIGLTDFQEPTEIPEITIIKYASDEVTIINQTTVDYVWMEAHLPVIGDGVTHYQYQGLTLDPDDLWDPTETKGMTPPKIDNAIKGTKVQDLCNLVGGMEPGTEITFVATDNWETTLPYDCIYPNPHVYSHLGDTIIAWYADGQYVPNYTDGQRLFFTPEDHVAGQWNMHEALPEEYWHYNYQDGVNYPSVAGLSAKWITTIKIYSSPATDWTLVLDGEEIGGLKQNISRTYFESALTCSFGANHEAEYTDSQGRTWAGMPLWFLAGFVDDQDQHSANAFNETLAAAGYDVIVTAGDGTFTTIPSDQIIRNNNYLVANTLNGTRIPEEDPSWPLRLVGQNVTGAMSVKGIASIELLPMMTGPKTWYVDDSGGADFTTIQGAVDAANERDTIIVRDGIYSDSVNISKQLAIQSEDGPEAAIVQAPISVTANFVNLSGLTTTDITVYGSFCNITENIGTNGGNGIRLKGSGNTIASNLLTSCKYNGIWFEFSGGDNRVFNNTITNNYNGIKLDWSNNNSIYLNNVIGNTNNIMTYMSTNSWNTTEMIIYTYNGTVFKGYLGNYYSSYIGTDDDGNGVGTPAYSVDVYPLMAQSANYVQTELPPAPVAAFTADVTSGTAPLTVQFTDASTGTPTSWAWDFTNDGTVDSIAPSPSHIYDTAGTYTVNLTVSNAGGSDSEVKTDYIVVSEVPPLPVLNVNTGIRYASIQAAVTAATAGDEILVSDGSYTENVVIDRSITLRSENGAAATTVTAANSLVPVFDVNAADFVTINGFSVRGATGSNIGGIDFTDSDSGTIMNNDVANGYNGIHLGGTSTNNTISYNNCHDNSKRGLSMRNDAYGNYAFRNTFSANADKDICIKDMTHDNVVWLNNLLGGTLDIGTANAENSTAPITYTYNGSSYTSYLGNYYSSYVGTDTDGNGVGDTAFTSGAYWTDSYPLMAQSVNFVETTLPPAPVAEFSADPVSGNAPLTVTFTDASTGTPTSWAWDFQNDGTVDSTEENPSHVYDTAGTYTVNLTVTNAGGSDSEVKTDYITVTEAILPVLNVNTGIRYASIQAAVTAATAGDEILVSDGSYTENVVIDRSITLLSENGAAATTVTAASTTTPVFDVNAANFVTIEGFTVLGATGSNVAGIDFTDSSSGIITNNDVGSCTNGIYLGGWSTCTNNTISDNAVHDNTGSGIKLMGFAKENRVFNNTLSANAVSDIYIKDGTKDNVLWLNNLLGGTLTIATANTENSPAPITYTYNAGTYTSYLGNYYGTYAGTDADGNGVGDTAFTSGAYWTDSYPLMAQSVNYI